MAMFRVLMPYLWPAFGALLENMIGSGNLQRFVWYKARKELTQPYIHVEDGLNSLYRGHESSVNIASLPLFFLWGKAHSLCFLSVDNRVMLHTNVGFLCCRFSNKETSLQFPGHLCFPVRKPLFSPNLWLLVWFQHMFILPFIWRVAKNLFRIPSTPLF